MNDKVDWSWILSIHTFFSTLLIYQFSRYNFHRTYDVSESSKDEIYQFLDDNLSFTKVTISISLLITIVTLFYLKFQTVFLIGVLGAISVIYPLKLPDRYGGFSLRSVPFAKIFMIAIVWSCMSVWVPFLEIISHHQWQHFIPIFAFQFLFILFITLPFDMADLHVDYKTGVKTIPSLLGLKRTKMLIISLAIGLLILGAKCFGFGYSIMLYFLLAPIILGLTLYSIRNKEKYLKWKVMAIYDGSMILYFLIFLIGYKIA